MRYKFGDCDLDTERHELYRAGKPVKLRRKVFELLVCLVTHADKALSKEELVEQVWSDRVISDATLNSSIKEVRQAIGDDGKDQNLIQTLYGQGYRFIGEVEAGEPETEQSQTEEPRITKTWNWRLPTGVILAVVVIAVISIAWMAPWKTPENAELAQKTNLPLPDKPSIAILPFDNMSGDPNQDSFADGLTENIITALSKFGDLFVIARHSTFQYKGKSPDVREVGRELGVRYVLEGSVQRSSDSVRVTAQLIDATTAGHIWADRFDHPLAGLFEVQDEITDHIIGVIAPVTVGRGKLKQAELERIARTQTQNLQAYDYLLRGVAHYDKFTKNDNLIAREFFDKALEIEPNYTRAMAKKAWTYINDYWNGWGVSPEESLREAAELARAAVASDSSDPTGYWGLASALLLQQEHDAAIRAYQRALELNPNEADVLIEYGWALSYAGQPEEGIPFAQCGIRLNPYHPGWYLWDLAWIYFVARRYEDAIAALERREPKTNFTYLLLAACYAQVHCVEEAAAAMKTFKELEPGYSIEIAASTEPFKYPEDLEHWLSALRRAGLPVKSAPDPTPNE